MSRRILIAHATKEEHLAEALAAPIEEAGYEVAHAGTVLVGESVVEEVSKLLSEGAPVVICATIRALGTAWARRVVNAARRQAGVRVFVVQMEEDVDVAQISFDEKVARYWEDPARAVRDLIAALKKHYPLDARPPEPAAAYDPDSYYAGLRKRYQRLDLEGLTPHQQEEYMQVQLRSVFVEQSVRDNPPPIELPKDLWAVLQAKNEIDEEDLPENVPLEEVRRAREVYYEKPLRRVFDVLTDPNIPYAVILGDPGSGKSTLTRYVLLSLVDPTGHPCLWQAFRGFLPILIELREYAAVCAKNPECQTFLDFVDYLHRTENFYPDAATLDRHLVDGGAALTIFDGLDEIFDPEERDQICRLIVGFQSRYPKTRILVTSRIIGYRRKILSDQDFQHFTLQDLDEGQARAFIRQWYAVAFHDRPGEAADREARLTGALRDSASIRQLSGNPMLLTILAIIGKNQELPRERWKLYSHAASVLIEHWDVNRHLEARQLQDTFIDADDKTELLRRLAYKMQAGSGGLAGNHVHRDQLQTEFEDYLRGRYGLPPDRSKLIAQAIIQQFRDRNFILSLYGANLYGFVHRAFLEYFAATAFTYQFEKTRKLTSAELKEFVFGKHWHDQSWHEVLRLITSMIAVEFAGEMIQFLATGLSSAQPGTFPPWNVALGIKCLSELKNPNAIAPVAGQLLRETCAAFDRDMMRSPQWFQFFKEQVVPQAGTIGPSWPQREVLADVLRERAAYRFAYIYDRQFGTFVGLVGQGNSTVHAAILEYARDPREQQRVLVPFALATGWHDHLETLPLIQTLADEPHETVRYAALYALAEHYQGNPATMPLLIRHAVNDEHSFGRVASLNGLATHFHDAPGIFDLLCERLVNDPEKFPRTAIVVGLREYFRDRPETLPLLHEVARRDPSPEPDDPPLSDQYVREVALQAIANIWPAHADTVQLLHDRAEHDPSPWLRQIAGGLIHKIAGPIRPSLASS